MFADVDNPSCYRESPTIVRVAIGLLKDADILPAILLVAEAQADTSGTEELCIGCFLHIETSPSGCYWVSSKEGYIPHLEFFRLFRVVAGALPRVLTHPKQICERHQCTIPNSNG